ncbi:MAG: hypothetical protein IK008_07550 [Bacteroidales bacterium]|nr:hypothetical protein [Bacteroidales bacterium]
MKRLFCIILGAFIGLAAGAQTRTYTDNATGTFIFGLENYFYGRAGSLEIEANGKPFQVNVDNGSVSVNGSSLEGGQGEVVVGTHDFTGNHVPELVVARRNNGMVCLTLYKLSGSSWVPLGSTDPVSGKELRVFRQVVSVRSGDTLHSWTWHGSKFDYKSNK